MWMEKTWIINLRMICDAGGARHSEKKVEQWKAVSGMTLAGDYFAAGAQDNGTQYFANAAVNVNGSTQSQGGDGLGVTGSFVIEVLKSGLVTFGRVTG